MKNLKHALLEQLKMAGKPLLEEELFVALDLSTENAAEFLDVVNELELSGEVIKTKKGKLALPIAMNLIIGTLSVNAKGFGFVMPYDKQRDDIFIAPNDLADAMDGDVIYAKILKRRDTKNRLEAKVVKVVSRANQFIVGTLDKNKNTAFVLPDNQRLTKDIYIPINALNQAKDGQKVVVEITKWAEGRRNPEGKIVEILGFHGDAGVDILSLIRKYKLPENFSAKVLKEAEKVANSEMATAGRKDLTKNLIITIDGADAKDLDDAVEVKKLDNGNYYLGVHIADVSHYVKENSKLDKAALKRGTSVYLVDRVIPMLPKELSNGICSLHPDVLRLTMSCEMEINPAGKTVKYDIYPSIIQSKYRMTYADVSNILEHDDKDLNKKYNEIVPMLKEMEELCHILKRKREERGAIDFNFTESYIEVNEMGEVTAIKERERRIANRIIEEFMLVANETVAEHVFWLGQPFVYRIHPEPDAEKIKDFNVFIHNFGYKLKTKGDKIYPKEIQKLLQQIAGKEQQPVIERLLLRSMSQAKYSAEQDKHFGLAAEYYCHFTSPIRRYPDLEVHRILKELIVGGIDEERKKQLQKIVAIAAEKSSIRERVAEKAERECDDIKKTEYMQQFVGEEFDGIISSVTNFGIFTQLENSVEGLTRFSMLEDDYYNFNPKTYKIVGERTKKTYALGDKIRVLVESVNLLHREINFKIIKKL